MNSPPGFGRAPCPLLVVAALTALCQVNPVAQDSSMPSAADPALYKHVDHLGWVVRDVDAIAAAWRALGVKDVRDGGIQEFPVVHRGQPVKARVKMAYARFENGEIQWIQPINDGTAYADFLARHGEGVHHVAFALPSAGRLRQEVARYGALGVGVDQSGTWTARTGTGHFAYLDTAPAAGGMTIALEHDPDRAAGGTPGAANETPFTRITQYAFAVRDIRRVERFYTRTGLGSMSIDLNVSLDRMYRGAPGAFEMLLGFARHSDVVFEWIQPTVGPNVYEEHLKQHGEGFHHLGFNVTDMEASVAKLRGRGLEVTMSGGWNSNGNEGRFAYLDADRYGGVTIELLWNKPRATGAAD